MAEVFKKEGKIRGKEEESDVFKPGFENKALVPNLEVDENIAKIKNIDLDLKDIDFDSTGQNLEKSLDSTKPKLVNPADVDIENHRIDWDKGLLERLKKIKGQTTYIGDDLKVLNKRLKK
jgi:hypothetical protein